jgi:hypothetical protein
MHPARITAAGAIIISALSACSADAPTVPRPKAVAVVANEAAPPASCPTVIPYRPLLDLASRVRSQIKLERVGNPVWRPVDFQMVSSPIGNAETGYVESNVTFLALLPPPKHTLHPQLSIGPGVPHCPPYDRELHMGASSSGFPSGTNFTAAQFANPGHGVWIFFMLVPTPGVAGSSPDFQHGPIIANGLFPLAFSFVVDKDGGAFDPGFEYDVPPLNDESLTPNFLVDGSSHVPMGLGESDEFAPAGTTDIKGHYVTRMQVLDSGGNGWKVVAKYNIKAGAQGR